MFQMWRNRSHIKGTHHHHHHYHHHLLLTSKMHKMGSHRTALAEEILTFVALLMTIGSATESETDTTTMATQTETRNGADEMTTTTARIVITRGGRESVLLLLLVVRLECCGIVAALRW